jgi:23S rRNA (cytosine1962-C5)-methyltransferase
MPAPFRKSPSSPPVWLPDRVWREIEATGTDVFLAAAAPEHRLERWGSTLRAFATLPEPPGCDASLLEPPSRFPWKPTRVIWQTEGERTAHHLRGEGWTTEVRELNLRYGIDLTPGTAPGLFPDQRENRIYLRSRRPTSLLNLFAHTCAFGVLAAAEGAATLNIDTSARALARGRENYRRNRLTESDHRFWKEDVRKVLPRLLRRGETFSAIILDPPTFAHGGRGRAFRMERELEPMLAACLRLLAPGGCLLVSINESHTQRWDLERIARSALSTEKIHAHLEPSRRPMEVPETRMPAGIWVLRED